MKEFVLLILMVGFSGCASKSLQAEETLRKPASSGSSNLQALKDALISANADCKIAIKDVPTDLKDNPLFANFVFLSFGISPPGGPEQNYIIVGEPDVILTRYFSSSVKTYKYSMVFKGQLLDSESPVSPNKLELLSREGKIESMSFFKASANLDGKGPSYGGAYSPCKFTK
jgi:hypothetical protein